MAEAEVKQAEAEIVAEGNCDKIERNLRKVLSGMVVSDKMDKTIIVKVDRRTAHPLYGKVVRISKKYYAHDENNEARVGDVVKMMETRPLSKLKRWRLISIERRAATE